MNLQVFVHNNQKVTDSREVAKMIGKRHSDLLESIQGYIQNLENGKFRSLDFFIPGEYTAENNNKKYPHYLLTKKGCDMVANKLTGEKGTLFTAAYINAFHDMENHIKTGAALSDDTKVMLAAAKLNNSRARASSVWLKISNLLDSPTHKQICASYASHELAGKAVIALPETTKTYTATEIGAILGISANKIGKLTNQYGLKTAKYGIQVMDKARHSAKEVPTFRYYDTIIPVLKKLLEEQTA